MSFKAFLKKLGDLVYPANIKCVCCGRELDETADFCKPCYKALPLNRRYCKYCGAPLSGSVCYSCSNGERSFCKARSPFMYTGNIVNMVRKFKYDGAKYLFEPLSKFMADRYLKSHFDCDIIVPVPVHKKRLKERGYNQAEELAKGVSKLVHVPIENSAVTRVKFSVSQTELSGEEREKNVLDSFAMQNSEDIVGKNVLVIDDVMTTGSTVDEVSKLLLENGANKVYVLTLAHSCLDKDKNEVSALLS